MSKVTPFAGHGLVAKNEPCIGSGDLICHQGVMFSRHQPSMFKRYAIYFTPCPDTDLAELGARWLGWDSAAGRACQHPELPGIDVAKVTERPRKYGFHGTLKPPFRLAEGTDQAGLERALHDFCAKTKPVQLEGLAVSQLGSFLALTAVGKSGALADLAAQIVIDFDTFRAPLNEAERAKRLTARLSPAQEAHLDRWGYPYVMDQFRFHMTLTGRLRPEVAEKVLAGLETMRDTLCPVPYNIDALTLLGEDDAGMFHQLHRVKLSG